MPLDPVARFLRPWPGGTGNLRLFVDLPPFLSPATPPGRPAVSFVESGNACSLLFYTYPYRSACTFVRRLYCTYTCIMRPELQIPTATIRYDCTVMRVRRCSTVCRGIYNFGDAATRRARAVLSRIIYVPVPIRIRRAISCVAYMKEILCIISMYLESVASLGHCFRAATGHSAL